MYKPIKLIQTQAGKTHYENKDNFVHVCLYLHFFYYSWELIHFWKSILFFFTMNLEMRRVKIQWFISFVMQSPSVALNIFCQHIGKYFINKYNFIYINS